MEPYEIEIDALNGICSRLDTVANRISSVNSILNSLLTATNQLGMKLDSSNNLQAAGHDLLNEIIGETIDIRKTPTDAQIVRFYIGDVEAKREAATKQVQELVNKGYRPYLVAGASEDLARVVFVKYKSPNTAE